jgi:ribosomal protein L7/L12
MTERSKASPWVIREVNLAEECRKAIVPLLLSGRAWFRLNDIQYIDVTDSRIPERELAKRLPGVAGPFDVVLTAGSDKLESIRIVRKVTGYGINDAMTVAEHLPATLAQGIDVATANRIERLLSNESRAVSIVPTISDPAETTGQLFDVVLFAIDRSNANCIVQIRKALHADFPSARAIADNLPQVLLTRISGRAARKIVHRMRSVGATAWMKPSRFRQSATVHLSGNSGCGY